ncbi:hypothetical protein OSTOST_01927 [Ostertagia ostertagi]
MNAQIATTKRLITPYGNKLEQLIKEYKGMKPKSLCAKLSEEAQKVNIENLRQLEEVMGAVDTLAGQLEATVRKFLTLRDSSSTGSEPDDNETYSIRAEDSIATPHQGDQILRWHEPASSDSTTIFIWDAGATSQAPKLINKLGNSHLRSQFLKDQRSLFEQIQVIIQELRQKGEQVDNQWVMKNILSKFSEELLRKPAKTAAPERTTHTKEEDSAKPNIGDHKPAGCGKFEKMQERAQCLQERNLCELCASAHHVTADCRRQPCFHCQGPHNTSCCFTPQ